MMRQLRLVLFSAVALALFGSGAYFTRGRWLPLVWPAKKEEAADDHAAHAHGDRVKLTDQARKNLKLVVKPVAVRKDYWKTRQIPGVIVDRPGKSDRGVTAPITGVVSKIHAFPSDTVKPGDPLFDVRLTSELIQNVQAELFKTVKEVQLQEKVIKRLEASRGAVPEARIIDARGQMAKLDAQLQASRQILQSRGLNKAQIDEAERGKFVRSVTVVAPPPVNDEQIVVAQASPSTGGGTAYEVQELKVHLGDQVQAGQVLGMLANHRLLYVKGKAFKSESPLLAKAAKNGWPVEAEFAEDDATAWPELKQTLTIRHLANAMDTASRTFGFFIPLINQAESYQKGGKTFLVWRFRPGQRVRLHVRVEQVTGDPVPGSPGEYAGVIVLPAAAVVREGPEGYVFRANGDAFDRKPVNVLYEDRREVVLANDGSITPGLYVAQNAAAALNRVLAAQKAGDAGHDAHAGHSH